MLSGSSLLTGVGVVNHRPDHGVKVARPIHKLCTQETEPSQSSLSPMTQGGSIGASVRHTVAGRDVLRAGRGFVLGRSESL